MARMRRPCVALALLLLLVLHKNVGAGASPAPPTPSSNPFVARPARTQIRERDERTEQPAAALWHLLAGAAPQVPAAGAAVDSSSSSSSSSEGRPTRALLDTEQQQQQQQRLGRRARRRRQLRMRRKLDFEAFLRQAREEAPAAADGAPGCDARVGDGYLERWRRLGGVFCEPSRPMADSTPAAPPLPAAGSLVRCNVHPAADLTACAAFNVLFDAAAFAGAGAPAADGLPRAASGSVRLACNATAPVKSYLRGRLANEGPRRWVVDAAKGVPLEEVAARCSGEDAVRHAVVFVMRVDGANAFHNAETLVHLFLGLAALQLPPETLQDGLQVIIADDRPPGFFLDILRRLSHPHRLTTLRTTRLPRGACLRTAVIAPWVGHANSLLAVSAEEVGCRSVLLHAASLWLRELFWDLVPREDITDSSSSSGSGSGSREDGEDGGSSEGSGSVDGGGSTLPAELQQQLAGARTLQFVWLSRAHFEASIRGRMTPWQQQRAAPNEGEVAAALQRAVARWNENACALQERAGCRKAPLFFALQVLELSELPFSPDQVFALSRAGVLAGVHGAGLTNMLFMDPGRGAVVEAWHGMEENYHYANLATALGHAYFNVKSEGKLPAGEIAAVATKAMDAVAERYTKQRRRRRRGSGGLLQRLWEG